MLHFDKKVVLLFICVLAGFICFNLIFPPQTDDIVFHIETLVYPDRSFLQPYFETNGKLGEQVLKYFAARYIDEPWLDVLNSLVSALFVFCVFLFVFARFPKDKLDYLSFALFCTMILSVNFAGTFLWVAGNLNYIWGLGLILLFLIPYRFFWSNRNWGEPKGRVFCLYPLFFVLAILAGWSSENIGATLCLLSMLSLIIARYKKLKLPSWYYVGILGFWCGWMILFFSPGSAIRGEGLNVVKDLPFLEKNFITVGEFFRASFWDQLMRINQTLNAGCRKSFGFFLLVLIWFFLWKKGFEKKKILIYGIFSSIVLIVVYFLLKQSFAIALYVVTFVLIAELMKISKHYVLFLCLFVIWVFIVLTLVQFHGQVGLRARLGEGLILATMIVLMFQEAYRASQKLQTFLTKTVWVALCGAVMVNLVNWGYYAYQWKLVNLEIEEQKKQGNMHIVIDKKRFYSFLDKDFGEMGEDSTDLANQRYAQYFGVESFSVK